MAKITPKPGATIKFNVGSDGDVPMYDDPTIGGPVIGDEDPPGTEEEAVGSNPLLRNQEYRVVDIDSIQPHPDNPNQGDEEAINVSMANNGFYGSVEVDERTGFIVAGNHRWKVAKRRGALTIPAIFLLDLDPVDAIRIMLDDNETARRASVDRDAVDELLAQLGPIGETGTSFDLTRLEEAERLREAREAEDEKQGAKPGGEVPDEIPDDSHEAQYAVICVVETEQEQVELFTRLKDEGLTVRVVSV